VTSVFKTHDIHIYQALIKFASPSLCGVVCGYPAAFFSGEVSFYFSYNPRMDFLGTNLIFIGC